jgi:hypothetical protein
MKKRECLIILFTICLSASKLVAQDLTAIANNNEEKPKNEVVISSFKNFKIVNAQTPMTVPKHNLEFCISHRFGDIAGTSGGANTLFGFYSISDILFSFDYGVTNKLDLGVGVYKGIGPFDDSYYGSLKYKLLQQTTNNKVPVFVTLFADANIAAGPASTDPTSDADYTSTVDRLSYVAQLIIARKVTRQFSIEVLPTYLHRNLVLSGDENDLFALGAGARYRITKRFSIIADYFHPFSAFRSSTNELPNGVAFYDPVGIGVEIETGGHVFTINLTNSTGIFENEFIPYTTSSWVKGQFRLGFNIGRDFLIGKSAQSSY